MVSCESPDSELITYCLSAPHDRIIGGIPEGNLIVRVSERTVIKFGPGLSRHEAINQQKAYNIIDHNIVRVPRVHRFFADSCGRGYIMMDYVQGKVVNPLEPKHIKRLARILDYFSTINGKIPGSLGGGPCRGLLWPETQDDLTFGSLEKMEAWFNSRLFPGEGKVSFQNCDLVLCHLDIAPRNIIWQPDGGICLVDWASAGFYPRLFEFWAQWNIEGKDGLFNNLLLGSMKPLQEHEMTQKSSICRVWYNIQKYAL